MRTYNIELNEQQLSVLNALLVDAPYRVAAPLINSFNKQIGLQNENTGSGDVTGQAISDLAKSVRRW